MKQMRKVATAVALACAASMALSACGSGTDTPTGNSSSPAGTDTSSAAAEPVAMTFWHNGTGDKAETYWKDTVADFEAANPNVTINIEVVQNEEFDGKLQSAMQAGTAPDVFFQRGGGKLADMVAADQVMDITNAIAPDIKSGYGDAVFSAVSNDGKIYAMPVSVQPEGLWYSQDLFKAAGITTNPTDMASLGDAVTKLKASGVAPISLGAQDAWPAAHWFYSFALRECSQAVVENLPNDKKLDDPCWLKAIQDYADFAATKPFNDGFLTTVAQQGAGSSAGLLANHKAAMELMGAWEPGVVGGLTPDEKNLPDLSWLPFPAVSGGQGDPSAMMGGVDAFSCSAKAPTACTDFLNFFAQQKYQEAYATAYSTTPANSDAMGVVTDPALKAAMDAYGQAKYVALWFDTSLGQDVGNAVNQAIVTMLTGQADAPTTLAAIQAVVKAG